HLAVDTQFEANLTLATQKVVMPPAQAAEPFVVHVDTGIVAIPTLDLQDLTADAVHLLNIHFDPGQSDSSGAAKSSSIKPSGGDPVLPPADPSTSVLASQTQTTGGASTPTQSPPPLVPADGGSSGQSAVTDSGITYVGSTEIIDGTKISGATEFK